MRFSTFLNTVCNSNKFKDFLRANRKASCFVKIVNGFHFDGLACNIVNLDTAERLTIQYEQTAEVWFIARQPDNEKKSPILTQEVFDKIGASSQRLSQVRVHLYWFVVFNFKNINVLIKKSILRCIKQ